MERLLQKKREMSAAAEPETPQDSGEESAQIALEAELLGQRLTSLIHGQQDPDDGRAAAHSAVEVEAVQTVASEGAATHQDDRPGSPLVEEPLSEDEASEDPRGLPAVLADTAYVSCSTRCRWTPAALF